jgi:cytochrome d ubiquinol oxidase subunit I
MEGAWHTERGLPLVLFAWPDESARTNHFEIAIPKLASLILTHELDGEVKGLDAFPDDHPPVAPVFFAFRIMVGVGLLMLLVSWIAGWQLWRRGAPSRRLAQALVAMSVSGWVATVAGWYVTEIGRQPWLVYGVLRTSDAAAAIPSGMLLGTFLMYVAVYLALLLAYLSVLFHLARQAGHAH